VKSAQAGRTTCRGVVVAVQFGAKMEIGEMEDSHISSGYRADRHPAWSSPLRGFASTGGKLGAMHSTDGAKSYTILTRTTIGHGDSDRHVPMTCRGGGAAMETPLTPLEFSRRARRLYRIGRQ